MFNNDVNVSFLDGVDTVTGSCHLLTAGGQKVLIDCGIHQEKDIEADDFNIPLKEEVDYCILTHAHLDHSGLLPLLVKRKKIRKNIVSTIATKLVAQVLLEDFANIYYRKYSKPIYNEKDLENTFNKWITYDYNINIPLTNNLQAKFYDAAHIIGSSSVYLTYHGEYDILFSGDIGTKNLNLMDYPPKKPNSVSYLVLESTYGSKNHSNNLKETVDFIFSILDGGGKVVIPAFSVGRAQEVIYILNKYGIKYTIYLDSPMSNKVTDLSNIFAPFLKKAENIKENLFDGYIPVKDYKESLSLAGKSEPCVIISASGMLTGGRVIHHVDTIKDDERSAIVFVGYQAEGTRGRRLLEGKELVKCKIFKGDGFSAHADKNELIEYATSFAVNPNTVFLTHGEQKEREELQKALQDHGLNVELPEKGKHYALNKISYPVKDNPQIEEPKIINYDNFNETAVTYFKEGILSIKKIKELVGMMYIGKKTALSWLNVMYQKGRLSGIQSNQSAQDRVYNFLKSCIEDLTLQDILVLLRALKQQKQEEAAEQ